MEFNKLILTLILSVSLSFSFGQSPAIDSLKNVLSSSTEDTNRVNTLLKLSETLLNSNINAARDYATLAKELAEKLQFRTGLALALKHLGHSYYKQANYIETLSYWTQSLSVFETTGDNIGISNMLNNIGAVYTVKGDDDKAIEYFLKSLTVAEKTGNKLRINTALMNVGSAYAHKKDTWDKALQYYKKAEPLTEELADKQSISTLAINIGEIYIFKERGDSALNYLYKALRFSTSSDDSAVTFIYIGRAYTFKRNYVVAISFHNKAYEIAKRVNATLYMTQALERMGENYLKEKNFLKAQEYYKKAEKLADTLKSLYELENVYRGLSNVYVNLKDYYNASRYQDLLLMIKDSIYNTEIDKKQANLETLYEVEKKKGEVTLLTKDKELQEVELQRQRMAKYSFMGGSLLILFIAFIIYRGYRNKIKINKILDSQKAEIESLILNILPTEVAQELQKTGAATPRYYEHASVLFTDFKGFSALADKLSPQEVVTELNDCFIAFDDIIERYKLEKIKTIGDSYMCAGGIPTPDDTHIQRIVRAGIEMQEYILQRNTKRAEVGLPPWDIRVGINTGPLVAGVVGKKKYAYDIWGGTVNIASRMESNGEPGKINISSSTYELIKDQYACTHRGKIFAKNIGEVDMYFIDHERI
jgi:adenylate cyclase